MSQLMYKNEQVEQQQNLQCDKDNLQNRHDFNVNLAQNRARCNIAAIRPQAILWTRTLLSPDLGTIYRKYWHSNADRAVHAPFSIQIHGGVDKAQKLHQATAMQLERIGPHPFEFRS